MSHHVLEVCVKKYAASLGKENRRLVYSFICRIRVFVLCVARAYITACVYVRGKPTTV